MYAVEVTEVSENANKVKPFLFIREVVNISLEMRLVYNTALEVVDKVDIEVKLLWVVIVYTENL